jgi:hypothetical protein
MAYHGYIPFIENYANTSEIGVFTDYYCFSITILAKKQEIRLFGN